VINAGVAAYSTDQELLFFRQEGKKYNPDLTIVMFYYNDVWYNNQLVYPYHRGHKPLFVESKGRLLLTHVPVPRREDKGADSQEERSTGISGVLNHWPLNRSYLVKFIREKLAARGLFYKIATELKLLPPGDENTINIPGEYRVFERHYDASVQEAWNMTEALIIQLREETAAINSKLLIVYVPHMVSIYPEEWGDVKIKYGISDARWDIDQPGLELQRVCQRNNVDFFNPTAVMRSEAPRVKNRGERLYYPRDQHWTSVGHKYMGNLLADFISGRYLIAAKCTECDLLISLSSVPSGGDVLRAQQ
jgi:hypothetical protein